MLKKSTLAAFIFIVPVILIYSCREEIIVPGNFAGNVNTPIQENNLNYYSLVINAKDLSTRYQAFTNFSITSTRALLTIADLSGGDVRILVRDKTGSTLYSSINQDEIINEYRKLSTAVPESVEFNFTNFTGKLKFSIAYTSN